MIVAGGVEQGDGPVGVQAADHDEGIEVVALDRGRQRRQIVGGGHGAAGAEVRTGVAHPPFDVGPAERDDVAGDEAGEAATDADHLVPAVEPEPHERLRRRVHAGSDATAVQDADAAASGSGRGRRLRRRAMVSSEVTGVPSAVTAPSATTTMEVRRPAARAWRRTPAR